ncbi:MAG: CDP-diacylglycerol--glycerol-3-phosphate 3-phosphatidyltransferase [Candidatus Caccosoma sp.]|nr:CDP-diacylglycerol--glycerol-3-phosphate 3-phosphatidyltransferase [Candidatus Caccosoma sp.]
MKFKEMNLPNKLTTIRMWCVPLVIVLFALFLLNRAGIVSSDVYLFISYNNCEAEHCLVSKVSETYFLTLNQLLIAIVFIFASITDFVDGHMARKNNLVSDYGKLMDPLADKLLVNTTLICMLMSKMFLFNNEIVAIYNLIPMIFAVLTIARDFFVDALRMQALKKNAVVPASIYGKLKTATLMPGIAILLFGSANFIIYCIGLLLVTLGGLFALIGGIKYFNALKQYID